VGLSVREARPSDARDMLALVRTALAEPGIAIPLEPEEFPYTLRRERRLLEAYAADEHRLFLVARRDDELAGLLNLAGEALPCSRHRVRLGMTVARPHRGRGVGRALLEAALAWAREAPYTTRVELDVYARNVPALRLYESCGFRTEASLRGPILEDGRPVDTHLMALALAGKRPVPYALESCAPEPEVAAPPGAAVRVRPADPRDVPALVALARTLRTDPDDTLPEAGLPDARDERERGDALDRLLEPGHGWLLVAEAGEVPVGRAWAERGPYRRLEHQAVIGVEVARPWRGRGVGRHLLETLHACVDRTGEVRRLTAFPFPEAAAARRLLASEGYLPEGRLEQRWWRPGRTCSELVLARHRAPA
jgi:putative acetyltransferase